jgi:predicted small integral membrane protein
MQMAVRFLKIVFVAFVGLMSLLYGLQNIVNLDAAFGAVSYVLRMTDHAVYPASLGPAITSPVLTWIALGSIIAGEIAAGLIALKGAWNLWVARRTPGDAFNASKTLAIVGCGIGVIVWMGAFFVVGGAYFQMWQTQVGGASFNGAFQYFMACFVVLLFVHMRDE